MKTEEIAALMPSVFRGTLARDEILQTLLEVMEHMLDPIEAGLSELPSAFNVLLTEDRFIPMLARWVDLEWLYSDPENDSPEAALQAWDDSPIPSGRLRMLIGQSNVLSAQRGTSRGLRRFLEIATGTTGFIIDELQTDPFHVVVRVPPAALDQLNLIDRIVTAEMPAYVSWEVYTSDGVLAGSSAQM